VSKNWVRLENLSFSESYEVQLWFKEENTSASGVFTTLRKNYKPIAVREVLVANYVSGADGKLYANVTWKPAGGELVHLLNCDCIQIVTPTVHLIPQDKL